jgi:ribose 5-phosphate isomerase B
MKTIKDKQILVAADFAGLNLKDHVVAHLKRHGWEVTDIGVQKNDPDAEMFHRIGFKVGAKIAEKEFEKALIFCGTGMGIHIACSKAPGVQCAVCESVPSALRAVTGNACNVLSMGGFYVAPQTGVEMADAFLNHKMGDGYEDIENWNPFHQIAYDEIDAFDYEEYKANGFAVKNARTVAIGTYPRP